MTTVARSNRRAELMEFHGAVRSWLERMVADPGSSPDDEAAVVAFGKHFARLDAGFAGLGWPLAYGGQRLSNASVALLPSVTATSGAQRFNAIFLDDAFVRDENRVGDVSDGCRVAASTLTVECVAVGNVAASANTPILLTAPMDLAAPTVAPIVPGSGPRWSHCTSTGPR